MNYILDIYENGQVNFTLGPDEIIKTNNTETLIKITPKQAEEILVKINNFGFESVPIKFTVKEQRYCSADNLGCMRSDFGLVGDLPVRYFVTLRDKNGDKTVRFYGSQQSRVPVFYAKVFSFLEAKFNLRKYTCGTAVNFDYYQYCVERNKEVDMLANQGDEKK